ncbi:MAG TPA: HEAT repeat domain-containing protein [Archangium sp.]|uniref:HEAT repeat domain-containing protein n=1 Tax=Archangium sp. TaxID=1872627 RepID=UPI002E381265|nr:HEAT repeat domain-containing protein [Archangium sp.]HEX5749150.1 HEAT repeat domain-containing protein [Archangium sp.]
MKIMSIRIQSLRPVLMLGTLLLSAAAPLTVHAGQAPSSQMAAASALPLRYEKGLSYTYQWSAKVQGRTFNQDEKQVGQSENATQFDALARVTLVEQLDAETYLLALSLEEPRISRYNEDGAMVEEERDPELMAELARPVYFKQNAYGQVSELLHSAKESPGTINLKRGIISALQSSVKDVGAFEAQEQDVSGIYRAKYEAFREGEQLFVRKQRTDKDYLAFADRTIEARDFNLESSSESVVSDKYGVVESFSSREVANSVSKEASPYAGEGAGMWSELVSEGRMDLVDVSYRGEVEPPGAEYVAGGLMAAPYDDGAGSEVPTDPKQVQALLSEDLSLLRMDPRSPEAFNRLLATLRASPVAVRELGQSLRRGVLAPELLPAAIGALGSLGTDEAQSLLLDGVVLSPRASLESKDQALVALSLAERPLPAAVQSVERLSADASSPLRTQATLVLGAMTEKLLSVRPLEASRIVERLERELTSARDTTEQDHLLSALGNAGHPASVSVIAPFLQHASPLLRGSAVEALRKMQSPLVDSLLLVRYSQEPEAWLRSLIASVQERRGREAPSSSIQSLTYYWSWQRDIGGSDIKARLFAELDVRDTPDLYVRALGQATAHAWSWQYTLLKAYALTDVVNDNGTLKRRFGAYLDLLNNRYFTAEYFLTCGQTRSGSLGSFTMQFFNLSKSFYPWGIRVTFSIGASGTVDGTYSYTYTACNAPVLLSAAVTVTPGARISAVGGATVSIYIARAGAEIRADILKTTLPATATGELRYGALRTCQNLSVTMQPISGNLSLWYQLRRWNGSWGSRNSWNVWSFSSNSYTQSLINRCLP